METNDDNEEIRFEQKELCQKIEEMCDLYYRKIIANKAPEGVRIDILEMNDTIII